MCIRPYLESKRYDVRCIRVTYKTCASSESTSWQSRIYIPFRLRFILSDPGQVKLHEKDVFIIYQS